MIYYPLPLIGRILFEADGRLTRVARLGSLLLDPGFEDLDGLVELSWRENGGKVSTCSVLGQETGDFASFQYSDTSLILSKVVCRTHLLVLHTCPTCLEESPLVCDQRAPLVTPPR